MSDEVQEVETAVDALNSAIEELQLTATEHDDVQQQINYAETFTRSAVDAAKEALRLAKVHADA